MKKRQIKQLYFRKNRIANLSINSLRGGGRSADVEQCETNTNTNSNFCPPETYDCPTNILNGCPPELTTTGDDDC